VRDARTVALEVVLASAAATSVSAAEWNAGKPTRLIEADRLSAQLEILREHVRFGDKAHLAIANTIAELERQIEADKGGGGEGG
jgi:hypothetical protein